MKFINYTLTISHSYTLTILRSYGLTLLRSYGLTVLRSYGLTILLSYGLTSAHAQLQVAPDRYRIEFTDKNNNQYTICQPQMFLSERALQRRAAQNVQVTNADLPVNFCYIDSLKQMGFEVLNSSRWFNSVTVRCLPHDLEKLNNVSFIKRTDVFQNETIQVTVIENDNEVCDDDKFELKYEHAPSYYGRAAAQIGMLNGHKLHERGFRGKGMFIAVIDGGFFNVNELSAFDSLRMSGRLRGFKNFTPDIQNPLGDNSHGTNVLSIIAACLPGQLIGSAPDADYLLIRSEEIEHEYIVEEDNWISAVEYADSIGVDIITTSLGYTTFDDTLQNHHHSKLDGRTVRTSRAATMAAARGMIVCHSAGNDGNSLWKYIAIPADADSIITIGAVNHNGEYAEFSSIGPTADNRVKPDLMAIGARTAYQNSFGSIVAGNGTSYSTPLIAGLIACLWQAYPEKTNMEIIEMVKRSATHFDKPNAQYGYGIPNFAPLTVNR